jgi:hypothetical protein
MDSLIICAYIYRSDADSDMTLFRLMHSMVCKQCAFDTAAACDSKYLRPLSIVYIYDYFSLVPLILFIQSLQKESVVDEESVQCESLSQTLYQRFLFVGNEYQSNERYNQQYSCENVDCTNRNDTAVIDGDDDAAVPIEQ